MNLSEIASIAGKGGLYHVLKPSRSGMIVETIDDQKKKMMVNINQRVSVLSEVSIYTTDAEGAVPLEDVFQKIYEEFGDDPGVDTSDAEELKAFMKHVVPEFDESRVYVSDMKKLVSWYLILLKNAPEAIQPQAEAQEESEAEAASADTNPEDAKANPEEVTEKEGVAEEKESSEADKNEG